MRFSIILGGAATASALTIPGVGDVTEIASNLASSVANGVVRQAVQLVSLDVFPSMDNLLSPQEAAENAGVDPVWRPEEVPAPPSAGNSRVAAAATCTNPRVRIEWRRMTAQHRADYVRAAKCLYNRPARTRLPGASNRHMDMAALHQAVTPSVHNTGAFLPYHRYYLWVYERLLREECGYTGPMTWWDETKDAGRFQHAPMFTQAHFGNGVPKTSNGQGTCITSGAFGGTQLTVGPGTANRRHCLSRAVDNNLSRNVNTNFVNSCNSHNNYTQMWSCSYLGPHGYGHNSVGAVMSDIYSSPGDPIFFLHHAFIDRNWRIWQNANRNGRLYQINGCRSQSGPCRPVTLDDNLTSRGIRPDTRIRNMMDTMGGTLCYKYDY